MDHPEETVRKTTLNERIVSYCKEGLPETLQEFYICLASEVIVYKPIILKSIVDKVEALLYIKSEGAKLKVNGDSLKLISHGRMKLYLSERDENDVEARVIFDILDAFWHQSKDKKVTPKVTLEE